MEEISNKLTHTEIYLAKYQSMLPSGHTILKVYSYVLHYYGNKYITLSNDYTHYTLISRMTIPSKYWHRQPNFANYYLKHKKVYMFILTMSFSLMLISI